jgi:hypothetical protein
MQTEQRVMDTVEVNEPRIIAADPPSGISAAQAVRKANGYLGKFVGMFFGATDPIYIAEDHPLWQVTVTFQMYDIGPYTLGTLDLDAQEGNVYAFPQHQIDAMQRRANAIAKRATSAAKSRR